MTILATGADGTVYAADGRSGTIYRIGSDGVAGVWRRNLSGIAAMAVTPEGQLLAAMPRQQASAIPITNFFNITDALLRPNRPTAERAPNAHSAGHVVM